MPPPTTETLRDLLSLLRAPPDESTPRDAAKGQDVGPYRSERETLSAQIAEEMARLDRERALLEERRALLRAVRAAATPPTFPRPFVRAMMLGAILGTLSSLATFSVLVAPELDSMRTPLAVSPPSTWREPPSAPPRASAALSQRITPLSDTVWDVDRRLLRDARLRELTASLRLVSAAGDEPVGVRLYGVRHGALADRLGLENGDLLVAINGRVLGRGAVVASRDFDDDSRIELALLRRGEPVTFTYLLR